MATISNGITASITNTPQAGNDLYSYTQSDLLASSLYNATTNVVTLDVMSNDLGGNAKTLFSIDDGNGNFLNDLLTNNVNTGWEDLPSGNRIQIVNGKIQLDISHSLDGQGLASLAAGETISETFDYSIRLGNGTLSWAKVSFTVVGQNDATTGSATASLAAGTEDTAYTLHASDLLAGFTDVDGDTLSVAGLTANHGTLHDNGNGTWVFTPAANYNGPVSLSYNVLDGNGSKIAASQSFALAAVSDAPALTGTAGTLAAGTEDTAYVIDASDLLAGYTDVENDSLSVTDLVATNGTLTATATGWSFAPDANFNGTVDLTYNVFDGTDKTAASQSFGLAAVNDAPATSAVTLTAIAEDSGGRNITQAQLLANAGDVESDQLIASGLAIASGSGSLADNGDGTWTYTPAVNDDSAVSFSYTVTDNGTTNGTSDPQSVAGTATLDITPVNDAPSITSDGGGRSAAVSVAENSSTVTTITASDADQPSQTLTYSIVGGADAAKFTIDGSSGALIFAEMPNFELPTDAGANNIYDVTVQVSDGTSVDTQDIAVTVTDVVENHAPTMSDQAFTVREHLINTSLTALDASPMLSVLANDIDGNGLTYSLISDNSSGAFALSASGQLIVSDLSLLDYEGAPGSDTGGKFYSLQVSVSDGQVSSPNATIKVYVTDMTATTLSAGNNIYDGGNSGESINALNGSDIVFGDGGNDTITGDSGAQGQARADTLYGGSGDDVLNGKEASDILVGGSGLDTFVFDTSLSTAGLDTITDFVSGTDTIKLENTGAGLFNSLATGGLSAGALDIVGAGPVADGSTRIIYDPSTGALSYDADGTAGGSAAVQFATLGTTTHPVTVSNADFVVI
jgi:large repetitive protein